MVFITLLKTFGYALFDIKGFEDPIRAGHWDHAGPTYVYNYYCEEIREEDETWIHRILFVHFQRLQLTHHIIPKLK